MMVCWACIRPCSASGSTSGASCAPAAVHRTCACANAWAPSGSMACHSCVRQMPRRSAAGRASGSGR
ncbi:Uncharacterised protein [Bordetella pertussis]|nr:Uncharacterised protein [Bordetella pertussis]